MRPCQRDKREHGSKCVPRRGGLETAGICVCVCVCVCVLNFSQNLYIYKVTYKIYVTTLIVPLIGHKECFSFINVRNNFKLWSNYLLNKKDSYCWPFIDLFIFKYSTDRKHIHFFEKDWDIEEFFPNQRKDFNGLIVSIPRNPDYFLSKNYGNDYMTKLKSSNWNHKKEVGIHNQHIITIEEYYDYIKTTTSI